MLFGTVDVYFKGDTDDKGYAHGLGQAFSSFPRSSDTGQPVINYDGFCVHGRRDGYGTSYFPNGCVEYKGFWKNNQCHGFGTFYPSPALKYVGLWKLGMRFGVGQTTMTRGGETCVFIGEYSNNMLHGNVRIYSCEHDVTFLKFQGRYEHDYMAEGSKYDRWGNILESGFYVRHSNVHCSTLLKLGMVRRDDYIFRGEFEDGTARLTGYGSMTKIDERGASYLVYEGHFLDGALSGHGTLNYPHSSRKFFTGSFLKDYIHGHGTVYHKSGHVRFIGNFEDHKAEGHGILYRDCSGESIQYRGMWHNDLRCGFGSSWNESDEQPEYHGSWLNDTYHGEGTQYYLYHYFVGTFVNGRRHGVGTKFNYNGDVCSTDEWRNGTIVTEDMLRDEKERELEVSSILELHKKSKHIDDVPSCPLCFEPMMHGDEIHAFNECGHRVCACIKEYKEWETRCILCKLSGQKRIRLF